MIQSLPESVELMIYGSIHQKAVTINSAFRTTARNTAVGGAKYSQHIYGTAVDIVISGISPLQIAEYAEKLMTNTGGIDRNSTFTHIDVRRTKSR